MIIIEYGYIKESRKNAEFMMLCILSRALSKKGL